DPEPEVEPRRATRSLTEGAPALCEEAHRPAKCRRAPGPRQSALRGVSPDSSGGATLGACLGATWRTRRAILRETAFARLSAASPRTNRSSFSGARGPDGDVRSVCSAFMAF